jgi:antitoxin HicB
MSTPRKTYTYTVHLEPAEEGGYVVTVPALPGCVTQGESYEEALEMAKDAIEGWLDTLAELGRPLPEEPETAGALDIRVEVKAPAFV